MHQREPIPRGMGDVSSAVDNGKWVMHAWLLENVLEYLKVDQKFQKFKILSCRLREALEEIDVSCTQACHRPNCITPT